MATTPSSPPPNPLSKSAFACIRCAERKVKCDRKVPCTACVNRKVDCVFQPPRPPRRRKRQLKDQVLTDRLKYYETLLHERGIDPDKPPETPVTSEQPGPGQTGTAVLNEFHLHTPASIQSEASGSVSKTQVIHGQGRSIFVDNSLWSRVVEEFDDPEEAFEDYSNGSSDPGSSDDDFGFVLSSRPKSSTKSRHPPPERIHQLWQIFIDNVDPLTKLVHVPTLRPAIQKAARNLETVPRGFEALMFAIYSAAVMSLSNDECKQRLGEARKTLLSRYMSATKASLSRARFMGTTSLVVLQALVLHLLSVRDIHEPRAVWSLTGVAVRIAQGMGLERDGVYMGLSPFESEMRRRLWWLLKSHDYRTADLCGLPKFRDVDMGPESTKRPANVNDDQLYPGMASLPEDATSLTDVAFVALRYEMVSFAADRVAKFRQQGKNFSQWDRDFATGADNADINENLAEIEAVLEMKYLRYCDPSQPLHLMTMLMARSSMNSIRFLTHHPRRWASIDKTPLSERQYVWDVSIKLLEQHNMLQSNPQLRQFAWQAPYVMQWHAFIHVLDSLRADPLIPGAERAWEFIRNTYRTNPALVFDTRKPIYVAVGSLCLKAYGARAAALLQDGLTSPAPTPDFILQLRRRSEVAKAKRHARDPTSISAEESAFHAKDGEIGEHQDDGTIFSSGALELQQLGQSAQSQNPPQPSHISHESDPFWLNNGFNDNSASGLNNMMDLDLDRMLADDCCMDDEAFSTITWEQWDSWLTESNSALSFSKSS
ncbi:mitogen-activated protein kinase [Dactylonectria estremocensis]|uniref:Mitogen-activated protein kinase n=1 Tax=Dactylonectria estremocensis TaxID=1079267 RepID=A0A9P9EN93_9HYPO|nr:mitogen-activated protein kinase [Dactylonectria estremocensis]